MKKIRKLRAIGIGFVVAAVAATPFFIPHHEADAAESTYHNWNELGTLDEQYAYAKVYYTADTVVTPKVYGFSRGSTNGDEPTATEYVINNTNDQIVFLLENTTAVDAYGNKVDVILRMDNLKRWNNSDSHAYIYFRKRICGTSEDITSSNVGSLCDGEYVANEKTLGPGDPVMFWINAEDAEVNFSIEFIRKGSYSALTTQGTPVPSVDRLSFATFDYDVKNLGSSFTDKLFGGDEGISIDNSMNPSTTKTDFYYQKTNQSSTLKLKEGNGGIAIGTNTVGNSFNGIYYSNSAIGIVTGMQNGKYTFRYSATSAGITAFFGSPIKYDTPAPKKYIVESSKTTCDRSDCSTNTAKVGDKFNYVIAQTIPDQFSSDVDILTFMSLWSKYPNIARDHFYTSFTISDTIDSNLTPATASRIKVYNSNNQDVTDLFTISLNNNRIQAVAKSNALQSAAFYATTFRIVVPVTVNDTVSSGSLKNVATTTFKQTGDSGNTTKTTNQVTTTINHTVTVKHVSTATGENLVNPSTATYAHGAAYETKALSTLPDGYKISTNLLPTNAKGTVTKNEVVTYYYDLYYTVTTKHISKQTGEEIADPVQEEYVYNDDYTTEASKNLPDGYVLVEMPQNATGTVDGDIEVIYVYDLAPTPKTFDAGLAPSAFVFAGIGAFATGAIIFLTRRR